MQLARPALAMAQGDALPAASWGNPQQASGWLEGGLAGMDCLTELELLDAGDFDPGRWHVEQHLARLCHRGEGCCNCVEVLTKNCGADDGKVRILPPPPPR